MSELVVLLSCMNNDESIIQKSNIQTDVIVVNQTENESVVESTFVNKFGVDCKSIFVNSTSRGLSRSRNLAISMASKWKYGLLCDDDEIFEDDYEKIITDAYSDGRNDLITFVVKREGKTHPSEPCKMKIRNILRTSSVQITFLIEKIIEKGVRFDEEMGAGTGNGAGEEVMFMMQCKRAGFRMYYLPYKIATLNIGGSSSWFAGFNEKYFQNRGWAARRTFGLPVGAAFLMFNVLHNRKKFNQNGGLTTGKMIKNCLIGIFSKR